MHLHFRTIVVQGSSVRASERTTFFRLGGDTRTRGLKQLVSLVEFDCGRRTIQSSEAIAYNENGDLLPGSGPNVGEKRPVAPDSLGKVTFEVACGLRH